jgi:hypothetical protein
MVAERHETDEVLVHPRIEFAPVGVRNVTPSLERSGVEDGCVVPDRALEERKPDCRIRAGCTDQFLFTGNAATAIFLVKYVGPPGILAVRTVTTEPGSTEKDRPGRLVKCPGCRMKIGFAFSETG